MSMVKQTSCSSACGMEGRRPDKSRGIRLLVASSPDQVGQTWTLLTQVKPENELGVCSVWDALADSQGTPHGTQEVAPSII